MSEKNAILSLIREHYPGYHPLVSIAHIAHTQGVEARLAFDCHKTIAQYVAPALKSVEVKGHLNSERRVRVSLFESDVQDAVLIEPATYDVDEGIIEAAPLIGWD